jgi:hypothetical protein
VVGVVMQAQVLVSLLLLLLVLEVEVEFKKLTARQILAVASHQAHQLQRYLTLQNSIAQFTENKMKKLSIAIAGFALTLFSFAQGVPNTFIAGDTVSSVKINQNFNHLDVKSKRLVLKNEGVTIGTIIPGVPLQGNQLSALSFVTVITNKGYFAIIPNPGSVSAPSNLFDVNDLNLLSGIRYSTSNCSGDRYTDSAPKGSLVYASKSGGILYVPFNAATVSINVSSQQSSTCQTMSERYSMYKLLSNDPNVTGWPSTTGTLSIAFE